MGKKARPPERFEGQIIAIPRIVFDSTVFRETGYAGRCLLMELARQLNGRNNGHLQLTSSWLAPRGWSSDQTIHNAKKELQNRGLIVQTRQGGKGIGPSRFAVTWLKISNFQGLELRPQDFRPLAFDRQPLLPPPKENHRSEFRSDSAPENGVSPPPITPEAGPKIGHFGDFVTPESRNNVHSHTPTRKTTAKAIVGRKGRSGKQGAGN